MTEESDSSLGLLQSFEGYSSSDVESPKEKATLSKQQRTVISTKTAINDLFKHKIKFNASLKSIQNVANILNINNAEFKVPMCLKSLKRQANMRFVREYHIFCESCNELCVNGLCNQCNISTKKSKSNFIIEIPLEQQIKASLDEHFDDIMDYANRQRSNLISDYDDCDIFKRAVKEYPDHIILALTINLDGAQVASSSKKSLWPIQLLQNYIPPNKRFRSENVLISTLYYGEKKPDMQKLLYPLASEIEYLQENPIKFWRNGKIFKCIPIILFCSADLPARAMLSGLKTYAGTKACTVCLHTGKQIKDHSGKKYIRYVKVDPEPELRTHSGTISSIKKNKRNDEYGLIEIPAMLLFPHFNLVSGFVLDYMHNVLLGVMRLLLDFWMGNHRLCKGSKFFQPMKQKDRDTLDRRLLALKPCSNITRKPRSVQERSFYKAIEYRNLLLFYLKFALRGLLDDKYVDHFELLSAGAYIFSKSTLCENEILLAEEMFKRFANQFESLYGSEGVTMNIHMLRHYGDCVRQTGPIWCHSMFSFETNIGLLGKCATNATDMMETISMNYCLSREENFHIDDSTIHTSKTREVDMTDTESDMLREKGIFPLENNKFIVCNSIEYKNVTYKSIKCAPTKSIDHYIQMKDGVVGCSLMYILSNDEIYVMIKEFKITEQFNHLERIESLDKVNIYSCRDISSKLIYMKFGSFQIISKEPNYYEIN